MYFPERDLRKYDTMSQPALEPNAPLENVDDLKKNRFRFLYYLFQKAGGRAAIPVSFGEVVEALGLGKEEGHAASGYLRRNKLTDGSLDIEFLTQAGVEECENLIKNPDSKTASFPDGEAKTIIHNHNGATYTTNIGSMNNSNVMQGSTGGTQTASFTVSASDETIKAVAELVKAFRKKLPEMGFPQEDREDVEASLGALETETKRPTPDKKNLRYHLRALQGFALNVATNIAAQPLIHKLQELLPLLMGKPS